MRNYGRLMVAQRFKPAGFTAPLGLEDMRLVSQSAETLRVPLSCSEYVHNAARIIPSVTHRPL